jgi:2-oxoglutarate ferredoxin oxidoreductase subunit delta
MVCPKKNLKRAEQHNDAGIFTVDVVVEDACTGCGLCFIMCPDVAITIE